MGISLSAAAGFLVWYNGFDAQGAEGNVPVKGRERALEQRQLCLPLGHDAVSLACYFRQSTGRPVTLTITDNSTSLFAMDFREGQLRVRLHRMFLGAGEDVLAELSRYMRRGRGRTPLFWEFVKSNASLLREKPARKIAHKTRGIHHDLKDMFERINREYFRDSLRCVVTWGARSSRRSVGHRTLGSYSPHSNTIRINTCLDRKSVPRYYVEYVLYHEMLHAALGVEKADGRRAVHTGEFKRRERLFAHYGRAAAWEKSRI